MYMTLPKAQKYQKLPANYQWIQPFVNHLAKQYKVQPPKVYVNNVPEINAWSSFFKTKSSFISITDLALIRMTNNQIKATLGHEIGHNKEDGVFNTLVTLGYGLVTIVLALLLYWLLDTSYLFIILLAVLIYISYILITEQMFRHSEFLADKVGAELTSPQDMISVMELFKHNEPKQDNHSFLNKVRDKMHLHPSNTDRINHLKRLE